MSAIDTFLDYIAHQKYAKDVRQAIVDAISQCYGDVSNPSLREDAFIDAIETEINNGNLSGVEFTGLYEEKRLDYDSIASTSSPTGWTTGYYDANGAAGSSNNFIRTASLMHIENAAKITVTPPSGYACSVALYDENRAYKRTVGSANSSSNPQEINVTRNIVMSEYAYIGIAVGHVSGQAASLSADQEFIDAIVLEVFSPANTEGVNRNTQAIVGLSNDLQIVNGVLQTNDEIINESNRLIKRMPLYAYRNCGGLDVTFKGKKIQISGTNSDSAIVLETDLDRSMNGVFYRQANNAGLYGDIADYAVPITPGHYKLRFKMVSGTVSRNENTYTSNEDFVGNVINVYLWKSTAASASDYYIKTSATNTDLTINDSAVGLLTMYIYQNCIFNNAVFELYVEDAAEETKLPKYWETEIESSIEDINDNIFSSGNESTTICFVTDCHWSNNQKWSPLIVQRLLDSCNINFFINGGDMVHQRYQDREQPKNELIECINAFRGCSKPMITVYGNHDRNTNGNSGHPELYLSKAEHANLVFKSFLPKSDITLLANDYDAFYWEDYNYRYVCLYWYLSASHAASYAAEMFNTTKKVIIICHGIYFYLDNDTSKDTIDNGWILNFCEPYKSQIRCFIQGHVHRDGIRFAWGEVPIVVIDCDTINAFSTIGTITEQSVAVITIDNNAINVVKVGKGADFVVDSESTNWRQEYGAVNPLTANEDTDP